MDGAGETIQRVRAAVAPSRAPVNTITHGVSPSWPASMARRVAVKSKRLWSPSHTTMDTARDLSASSMVHNTAAGFLSETVSSRSWVRPKRARPWPYSRPYSDTSPSARTHSTGRRSSGFRPSRRRAARAAAKPIAAGASPQERATTSWAACGSSPPAGSRASMSGTPVRQPVAAVAGKGPASSDGPSPAMRSMWPLRRPISRARASASSRLVG